MNPSTGGWLLEVIFEGEQRRGEDNRYRFSQPESTTNSLLEQVQAITGGNVLEIVEFKTCTVSNVSSMQV